MKYYFCQFPGLIVCFILRCWNDILFTSKVSFKISWLVVLFYGATNTWCHLKRIKSFWEKFQTIQFSINTVFVYSQLNVKTVLFQTIQYSISTHFKCQKQFYLNNSVKHEKSFVYIEWNVKTVLFQRIQFNISTLLNIKTVNFKQYSLA